MFNVLDTRKSTIGNYNIAVVESIIADDSQSVKYLTMIEVKDGQNVDEVPQVFSQTYADPVACYTKPLLFTATAINLIDAMVNDDAKVVIGGLGAGAVHMGLLHHRMASRLSSLDVLSVEIDSTVVDLAEQYWGFDGDYVLTSVELYVSDLPNKHIDLLFINTFSDDNGVNPPQLCSDNMDMFLSRIADGGKLVINALGDDHVDDIMDLIYKRKLNHFSTGVGANTFIVIFR